MVLFDLKYDIHYTQDMLGLALQGGGAKGAFQAGALRALTEAGYQFDGVVGTSIGALNGALVAQNEIDKIYELWYNMEISQLFDIDDGVAENLSNMTFNSSTVKYVFKKIKDIIVNKGLDRTKAKELINTYLNESKLRKSPIDYGLVTIEWNEGFVPLRLFKEDIPEGLLIDYIIASGNLPVFKDLSIADRKYLDGGMYDNLPVNMLIDKGYKDIVAIRLGETMSPIKEVKDPSVRITYIDPTEKPGSLLNFTNKSVRKAITMGYFDTLRILKGYTGKRYYIIPFSESLFYTALYDLPNEYFTACSELLGVPFPADKDGAINTLLKEIALLLKLKEGSPADCIIELTEIFAEYSGVERFRIYTFPELLLKTIKAYRRKIDFSSSSLDKKHLKLKGVFDLYLNYLK
jgi:NTE family protein